MRNAVKRITHKERDQPSDRKKRFGLLEKHVDYKIRADDYKKKKSYIKNLKLKALERNPDEFYFNMNNAKVENGHHRDTTIVASRSLDVNQAKVFKTQDLGYLNMKNSIERAKINKLRENLHWTDGSAHPPKLHKKFIYGSESIPKVDTESKKRELISKVGTDDLKAINSMVSREYKELYARTKRSAKLEETISKLNSQKNLMSKGAKRKLQTEEVTYYKWKRIRSK